MTERPSALNITQQAAEQIKHLIDQRTQPTMGVRIGIRTRGCSGYAYTLEFSDKAHDLDEIVKDKGVTVFIDPKSILFVLGTEMDFVQDKVSQGFVFKNPNEKGRCGCGESFHL